MTANETLIEMFNKEVEALKAQYPSIAAMGKFHENTPDDIRLTKEYEAKHREIYNRYTTIMRSIK